MLSENENIEQNKREKVKLKVRTNIISMIFRLKFSKNLSSSWFEQEIFCYYYLLLIWIIGSLKRFKNK